MFDPPREPILRSLPTVEDVLVGRVRNGLRHRGALFSEGAEDDYVARAREHGEGLARKDGLSARGGLGPDRSESLLNGETWH